MGGEELGGDEDSSLLTAPARRDDLSEEDERHYEKSSYKTVAKRGGDTRRNVGPRRRNIKNTAIPETSRLATDRSRSPGKVAVSHLGLDKIDFKSLVGLEEQKQSIYTSSETRLMEDTRKVRMLVEQLESKEAEKDET